LVIICVNQASGLGRRLGSLVVHETASGVSAGEEGELGEPVGGIKGSYEGVLSIADWQEGHKANSGKERKFQCHAVSRRYIQVLNMYRIEFKRSMDGEGLALLYQPRRTEDTSYIAI
jgi:hypothetical protein